MIDKAKKISKEAHKNQTRKFEGEPYFVHPERVAQIIFDNKDSKHINELVSSGYLHDVIEDAGIPFEFLKKEFGYMVASIVLEVTNEQTLMIKYGKKNYMSNKVLTLTNYGLIVKLSDRLDNVSDLHLANQKFRKKYIDETEHLLQILEDFRDLTETQKKLIKKIKEKLDV